MDAKDVKTHVSQLDKAVKEKLPASHLLDLLNALKKDVVATESLLRETRVGMAVNKLRMNPDKSVADLAKDIVGKWKNDVNQRAAKPASQSQARKASTASPTATTPMTPPKPKKKELKAIGDPSKRNKLVDGVGYKCTGDKARDNCVGLLYDGLCLDSEASADQILQLAKDLETEVFKNHKRQLDMAYKRRIQSLYLNLKDKKNPGLRKRVVSGQLSVERLSTMDAKDMASEERRKEDEALQQENMRESMTAKAQPSVSDQLTCGKCGQKKVSYTQAQTRSADEPMTTFCNCTHCGNMWKFS